MHQTMYNGSTYWAGSSMNTAGPGETDQTQTHAERVTQVEPRDGTLQESLTDSVFRLDDALVDDWRATAVGRRR
jgi:hypothetical protein